ncbi:tyrosine-type recombinase/integrase [Cetobacterium sp. 2A]|uniref:tyrosine-type recombinase/integrase n=1 Tax=Cetobacterium sp. 2A TaxID=2754723 RepID=UPI00163CA949|nr:tyrosine-type recombinase/integrase [Cetobacterium sp. 2A]MBC2856773.1 tyrosine-type recombinase/integrase [Cetobacterium sp. 2A]
MDIIIKEKGNIVPSRRKKKVKEERKSIFEIYRSSKTLKDYFFYLKDFLNFVYDGSSPIEGEELIQLMTGIEMGDVEDYLSHLINERNLKKTSINKILSALKSLYRELEKNGHENPFKYIQLFKTSRDLENILKLSFEDIKEIIKKYDVTGEKEYRNTIILYTLFYTGMRSQELLDLQFKHILKRDGEYFLKLEKTKSGREQYKPLHDFLVKKLMEYKNYISNIYLIKESEFEERFLFPSSFEKNKPLSYRALYNVVQDLGKVVGKNISPHNVRHAIATELSLNGADLIEIRDFLGHADTKVTEVYINAKSIIEKRVLEKIPMPNIDDTF